LLVGGLPSLSIEVTRECPLTCPGCYAYNDDHLGGALLLREVRDLRGRDLVRGIVTLVDRHRPLHVSLVGGEPLVRHREITEVLPVLAARGVFTQVVTSAVRTIPPEWREMPRLSLVVSIDGLAPEHDARRKPATYERILATTEGMPITVHCTVTRQMTLRSDYLEEFVAFWSARPGVRHVWMSLFTPQKGETSTEILPPETRGRVIDEIARLARIYPLLQMPDALLDVYRRPPASPADCVFARTTQSFTADLATAIVPCQFGGDPDCSQCGCIASAAIGALARGSLPGGIRIGALYEISSKVGERVRRRRRPAAERPCLGVPAPAPDVE
jgi:MoaA/NifB/PqqE/SkfB family radical SAM enzyme